MGGWTCDQKKGQHHREELCVIVHEWPTRSSIVCNVMLLEELLVYGSKTVCNLSADHSPRLNSRIIFLSHLCFRWQRSHFLQHHIGRWEGRFWDCRKRHHPHQTSTGPWNARLIQFGGDCHRSSGRPRTTTLIHSTGKIFHRCAQRNKKRDNNGVPLSTQLNLVQTDRGARLLRTSFI